MPIIRHGYATRNDYGPEHRRRRFHLEPLVKTGSMVCPRCHEFIKPDEPWDLDHTDDGRGYLGPSHRRCNRRTA